MKDPLYRVATRICIHRNKALWRPNDLHVLVVELVLYRTSTNHASRWLVNCDDLALQELILIYAREQRMAQQYLYQNACKGPHIDLHCNFEA